MLRSVRARAWVRVPLAALCGVLLSCAFAPVGIGWLIPVAVAGFVLCTDGLRVRQAWLPGLAFGAGFHFVLLWWIQAVGLAPYLALAALEASFYGVLGAAVPVLRRLPGWQLWFATAWIAMEQWRSYSPFSGMPWGRLAYGTADTAWPEALPWVGMAGLSWLLALAGVLLARVVQGWSGERRARSSLPALAGLVVVLGASLLPVVATYTAPVVGSVTVAVVQGNVPGDGSDVLYDYRQLTRNHTDATVALADDVRAGRQPAPDFVVWPENSTASDPFFDPSANGDIREAVSAVDVPILVGGMVDVGADRILNQGIVWDPDTGPGDRYTKQHPVPFGEYVPWRHLFEGSFAELQRVPRDMMAGTRTTPLTIAGTEVADAICFDIAYDDGIRAQILSGARMLVVQNSDASFVHFPAQLRQQFDMTRLRAQETRRATAVASTNGVTGIIAPDGTVLDQAVVRTQDVLVQDVGLSTDVTPGIRLDGWLGPLAEAVSLLGLALGLLPYRRWSRRRRTTGKHASKGRTQWQSASA